MPDNKPASFATKDMKEGSNLFDNVRASLTAGKFTKEPPDNYAAEGDPIFGVITLLLAGDGSVEERTVQQSYSLGGSAGQMFTIAPNGDYLIPSSDDAAPRKDSKFGTLAASMQNEGVPESLMEAFQWSKMVGLDAQWKRVADKERTFAEQKRDARKTKFPPSTLCVVKIYALPGEVAKSAPTPTAGSTGTFKPNGGIAGTVATPAAAAAPSDLDGDTWSILEAVLKAKGGTEQRGRLTLAVSKAAMERPDRAMLAKRAAEEAFLQTLVDAGLISYGAAEKGQPVTLVAS